MKIKSSYKLDICSSLFAPWPREGVNDLPFDRVAPDPQQPSGLGQRGLSRGACGLLSSISRLMIQRCLVPSVRVRDTIGKGRGAPD